MTAIVLQARLDSSRLPQKALLLLVGKPLILRVMEALGHIDCDLKVLACPEDSNEAFSPLAAAAGFQIVTGPKEDVLERYCIAIRKFSIDRVIRATGDNPFVFADAAAAINKEAQELNADYAGYSGLPYGAGVESVKAAALLRAAKEAKAPTEREHVCPYLYNHPELFNLHRPVAPLQWLDSSAQNAQPMRLTVDTPQDFENAQKLFTTLDRLGEERYRGAAIIAAYRETFRL